MGDYFGELALIRDQPRAANVIADGKMKVLAMDRASFIRLLGPVRCHFFLDSIDFLA